MYIRGHTKIIEFYSVALISDRAMARVGMSFRLRSDAGENKSIRVDPVRGHKWAPYVQG